VGVVVLNVKRGGGKGKKHTPTHSTKHTWPQLLHKEKKDILIINTRTHNIDINCDDLSGFGDVFTDQNPSF
jgi:hypothetical protein